MIKLGNEINKNEIKQVFKTLYCHHDKYWLTNIKKATIELNNEKITYENCIIKFKRNRNDEKFFEIDYWIEDRFNSVNFQENEINSIIIVKGE